MNITRKELEDILASLPETFLECDDYDYDDKGNRISIFSDKDMTLSVPGRDILL